MSQKAIKLNERNRAYTFMECLLNITWDNPPVAGRVASVARGGKGIEGKANR